MLTQAYQDLEEAERALASAANGESRLKTARAYIEAPSAKPQRRSVSVPRKISTAGLWRMLESDPKKLERQELRVTQSAFPVKAKRSLGRGDWPSVHLMLSEHSAEREVQARLDKARMLTGMAESPALYEEEPRQSPTTARNRLRSLECQLDATYHRRYLSTLAGFVTFFQHYSTNVVPSQPLLSMSC